MNDKKQIILSRHQFRLEFHIKDSDGKDIGKVVMPKAGQRPAQVEPEQLAQLMAQKTFADLVADNTYQLIDHMPKRFETTDAQVAVLHARVSDAEKSKAHAEGLLSDAKAENEELKKKLEGFEGTLEVADKLSKTEAENEELKKKLAELEKVSGKKQAAEPSKDGA